MKLVVIAVGARMPTWVTEAWDEYAKRMPADSPVELKEIRPEPRTTGKTPEQLMAAEARRIEAAIPPGALRVALDEHGQDLTSEALARRWQQWRDDGRDVALIIGGPDGLERALKDACPVKIRLSSLTMPHPLVRVLLIEQLYRAWSINHNHPYHRA